MKLPCQKHLKSFSRFGRTVTCDRHRQTDTDRRIASPDYKPLSPTANSELRYTKKCVWEAISALLLDQLAGFWREDRTGGNGRKEMRQKWDSKGILNSKKYRRKQALARTRAHLY